MQGWVLSIGVPCSLLGDGFTGGCGASSVHHHPGKFCNGKVRNTLATT
jgi:hypothetical protein